MPKSWAKGLTKETDGRVARAAEGHRGRQYQRRRSAHEMRGGGRQERLTWSAELAYAVGLTATDGCLLSTGRHVAFVSTDDDQMANWLHCVGRDDARVKRDGRALRATLGDVELYRWLGRSGLTARKSLTLGPIEVPAELFVHLVRGLFDGDGSISHYVHRPIRARYPGYTYRRLVVRFHSASLRHLIWLQDKLYEVLKLEGALLTKTGRPPKANMFELKYAKYASIALLSKLYEDPASPRLLRKWRIWEEFRAQPVTTRPYLRRKPRN